MSLRTEYIRNFYADHQTNFGQPDGTPTAVVRAAALREFDEWLREVKAGAWGEGWDVGRRLQGPRSNPYKRNENA